MITTENDAIEELKFNNEKCLEQCEGACFSRKNNDCACQDAVIERMLDELLQYREIGTAEECRVMESIISKVERNELAKIIDEWLLYRKIGTVEECREAREKQIPKECIIDSCPDHTHYKCPSCGEILMSVYPRVCGNGCITPYCKKCGQALRMENKDD